MKKINIVIFLFFLLCFTAPYLLFAGNQKDKSNAIKRMNEFVELIQCDIKTFPYRKVHDFLNVTREHEGTGEFWTYKLKEEIVGQYKISFNLVKTEKEFIVSKLDKPGVYYFGSLKFDTGNLDESDRAFQYKKIKEILHKKFGRPVWDRIYKKGTVKRTMWWTSETTTSQWSLSLKTTGIGKKEGGIRIIMNRKPKDVNFGEGD